MRPFFQSNDLSTIFRQTGHFGKATFTAGLQPPKTGYRASTRVWSSSLRQGVFPKAQATDLQFSGLLHRRLSSADPTLGFERQAEVAGGRFFMLNMGGGVNEC